MGLPCGMGLGTGETMWPRRRAGAERLRKGSAKGSAKSVIPSNPLRINDCWRRGEFEPTVRLPVQRFSTSKILVLSRDVANRALWFAIFAHTVFICNAWCWAVPHRWFAIWFANWSSLLPQADIPYSRELLSSAFDPNQIPEVAA